MASVKVFGLPASTEVARVLTCLTEKNVEFQLIHIDTYKGDHKVPEFLSLQDPSAQVIVQDPSGEVTFKDGTRRIRHSRDICRHISEKYAEQGNKGLLGTGSIKIASIEQWLQAETQTFDPPSSALIFHLGFAPLLDIKPDQNLIERSEKQLSDVLDIYNKRLEDNNFLAGDEFTLADLSHLPNAHYLVNKTERGHKLFTSRRNVDRWWKDISSRESWKKVVNM